LRDTGILGQAKIP